MRKTPNPTRLTYKLGIVSEGAESFLEHSVNLTITKELSTAIKH